MIFSLTLDSLHQLFVSRSKLLPLAQHAAQVHTLLRELTNSVTCLVPNWNSFDELFKSSLGKERGIANNDMPEAIQAFDIILLQDSFKYVLDQH